MTTVNAGYEARIREALKQAAPKASSFTTGFATGFPTVGFLDTSAGTGFFGKIAPYLIYALLITFVILLILVVVHYTVTPIFNFGSNPDALINLTAPDWNKTWADPTQKYVDQPANSVLPKYNYSFSVDVNVGKIAPSAETRNTYVLAYKTAGILLSASDMTAITNAGYTAQKLADGTCSVVPPATGSSTTGTVRSTTGAEFKADTINDFAFLETPQAPADPTKPSMVLAYNAIAGQLTVYFVVTNGATSYLQSVYAPIYPNKSYRVGVVVSEKMVELYIDGMYISSKVYPDKTIAGTDNDVIVSVPTKYAANVAVANIFTTNRVVSSGEIRGLGGPAAMKLD
jgi:hypothetical protein